ncbi:CoA-acylating methylmalonate-semialdehyde dehydrogenase [Patulibacter sp. SYSU D01012]|uniref:CoA-acylating methylmalonate-semialdehyde dehydrogenase n=1 Tax=Patulibacter sp. SYSU D01012 TaxID=2817381 RepID=UPI001B30B7A0|nr:CoA-acylating methylmalonate-semialdehyde dehydrogenase [Patulibacter sp. SYSU D01012]
MTDTVAPSAVRTLQQYIGGQWTPSSASETLDDRNPATGELLARVPLGSKADVDAAVRAAAEAQVAWRRTAPQVRARALYRLRDVLDQHRDELAALVTQDMGKTLDDAAAEVGRGIESVEAAMAAPHLLKGQNLEGIGTGVDVESFRQPIGVVAAITPFNFPAMIPMWFLPFALATGNGFVLKPSEQVPLTAERYVELIEGIEEIPKGLVNLVHGAHDAVNGILEHPGIGAVSFVGAAKTARYVATRATEHGKRVQALGGAKNAFIVLPDADPKTMAGGIIGSAFGAAGQRCMAGSVAVLVGTQEQQDAQLERIVEAARALRSGPGDDPQTDVCPVVSSDARTRLVGEIDAAERDGIQVVLDGRTADPGQGQANLGPTILDGVPQGHRVATEELFGPVLSVVRAKDLDEALAFTNASRYGNSTILFTESGGAAREFRYRAESGMLGVNVGVAAPIAWMPFGGWKDSIDADLHANGEDGFRFYTRTKIVTTRWSGTSTTPTTGGMRY